MPPRFALLGSLGHWPPELIVHLCFSHFQSLLLVLGKLHAFQAVHRHVLRLLAACIVSHQACT